MSKRTKHHGATRVKMKMQTTLFQNKKKKENSTYMDSSDLGTNKITTLGALFNLLGVVVGHTHIGNLWVGFLRRTQNIRKITKMVNQDSSIGKPGLYASHYFKTNKNWINSTTKANMLTLC